MNKPNFGDNLRELAKIVKALLVVGLVVLNFFVWTMLYGLITAEPTTSQKMRDPNCNFLPAATVSVGKHSIIVPALKHTMIWFTDGEVPVYDHVRAVWGGESTGFCEAFVPEHAKAWLVQFRGAEANNLAIGLDLPSFKRVDKLSIGTRGAGAWLSFPEDAVQAQNVDFLLIDDTHSLVHENGSPWVTRFYSAGHLEGGLRMSASCTGSRDKAAVRCGVRITRTGDGMVFEVWGINLDELPQDNQKMPLVFALVAERLPLLLEHLQQERPL